MERLSEHCLADNRDGSLNLMYRIGEQTTLHEEVLEHFETLDIAPELGVPPRVCLTEHG